MATGDVKRKLTAIFSADVEGYSRLMEEDELATVETLTSHKEIMRKMIRQYRGRVVDSTGDNLLAEFGSVVDAVQCAVEVQQVLSSKNETLPENRRMNFRIGINSGDVIEEGDLIYGDGVNVAARVESLAEGGGISISGTAYDQLGKKLPLGYEYLGEQTVKNIEKPVRVYRVLTEAEAAGKVIGEVKPKTKQLRGVAIGAVAVLIIVAGALAVWNFYFRPAFEPASVEKMAFPLPDKPSIAVLPFVNMSEDPKQEYFSDGLTDQIISGLSKVPHLFVIARNSTFTYKGKPVKVQKVAEDLGVRYILEGSVQKSEDRIRITAQLIDATTGHHLWSERYERDLKDIFTIQDEICLEIMKAMQIELSEGEQVRQWLKHATDNLEAYEKALQARSYGLRATKEGNVRMRQLYEEVIALDPGYATGYAGVGWSHFFDARFGLSNSPPKSIKMAFNYAQKAIELDETLDWGHILLSAIYVVTRQHEKAIAEAERAVALNPNGADAYSTLAGVLGCSGRWEEGIPLSKKAIRLNPHPTVYNFHWLGRAYFMTGQYDEAILTFKKALAISPNYLPAHAFLAASYSSLGRETETTASAEEVLRINPKFSLMSYAKTLPYKNKSDIKLYMAALRKAGLPETPPLPLPDKPSIAVLPFVNMSGDPEQEYLSDGITESIITGLAKTPKLFVIARNSTFTYKGKPTNVQKVGRELGVRYVLEGSVQKSKDRIRITAQLVDAKSGNHVWAEQYDRELKEIFALQDEITMKILTALRVKLTAGEQARLWAKGTKNLNAYLKLSKAREYLLRGSRDDNVMARQFAQETIALDPDFPGGYNILAATHLMDILLGATMSPGKSIEKASELVEKALALDDSNFYSHNILGRIYLMKRAHEKAITQYERALELNPNVADAYALYGLVLNYASRPEEAIVLFKKAIRLNPIPPNYYLSSLANAYRMVGQYDEAIAILKKLLNRTPDYLWGNLFLTATYSEAGRADEALAQAAEVLRIDPNFSLENYSRTQPYKYKADRERHANALRNAGLE